MQRPRGVSPGLTAWPVPGGLTTFRRAGRVDRAAVHTRVGGPSHAERGQTGRGRGRGPHRGGSSDPWGGPSSVPTAGPAPTPLLPPVPPGNRPPAHAPALRPPLPLPQP